MPNACTFKNEPQNKATTDDVLLQHSVRHQRPSWQTVSMASISYCLLIVLDVIVVSS